MSCAGIAQPACDPKTLTKTYQFRSLQKFAERAFNEWKLDDVSIRQYIMIAVKYAKNNGLLSRGAGVLILDSVARPTFDLMATKTSSYSSVLDAVSKSYKFVDSLGSDDDEIDRALLRPIRYGGYQSIIYYNKTNKISDPYLAISKRCVKIIGQLPDEDRQELPTALNLKVIRIRLYNDVGIKTKLVEILGEDLILG